MIRPIKIIPGTKGEQWSIREQDQGRAASWFRSIGWEGMAERIEVTQSQDGWVPIRVGFYQFATFVRASTALDKGWGV